MNVMKLILVSAALVILTAATALADFSYQETTKVTGGTIMHMAGGSAVKPQTSATYVKGNRLARIGPEHGQITDLDKETITNVNYAKKTYSVMTFAEMKAMLAQMSPETTKQAAAGGVDVNSHETGKTRTIGHVTAKEVLMTVKVAGTKIDSDIWIAPMVPGYDEVRKFQLHMAEKMGSLGAPGMQRTMAEAAKALTRVNGVPVLQTSSIDGGAAGGAAGGPAGGAMMETSTELSNFSATAVDASKFEVPAGFQKVEGGMGRRPAPHGKAGPH
jgi:hypothetical protein